jgi:hypothetical protein
MIKFQFYKLEHETYNNKQKWKFKMFATQHTQMSMAWHFTTCEVQVFKLNNTKDLFKKFVNIITKYNIYD